MTDTPAPTPAPTPTPAPAPAPTPPWYEGKLDAELLGHIENKGWKKDDAIDVAINATKQARELQKHFGVPPDQLLKLPKDTADEAGWRGVRERLGMPKEAKDYDFSSLGEVDASLADKMRGALHKAGVAKDSAPEVLKAVVEHLSGQKSAADTERAARLQTERAELQKDWGSQFDFNRLTAMQGAKRLGVDEATVAKLEGEVGYAKVMEMFRKVGAGTNEDTFVDTASGGNPTTRNGAVARLAELKSDAGWGKRLLAGDASTKREFDGLMQLIHGSAA